MGERMKLIEAKFGKRAPDGLADDLRKLADAVDRGEVAQVVAAYVENDEFVFNWGASLYDGLVLTALLHAQALARMREAT